MLRTGRPYGRSCHGPSGRGLRGHHVLTSEILDDRACHMLGERRRHGVPDLPIPFALGSAEDEVGREPLERRGGLVEAALPIVAEPMYFIAASIGDCPHARSRCGPISKNEPRRSAKHPGRGGHEAQGRAESDARTGVRLPRNPPRLTHTDADEEHSMWQRQIMKSVDEERKRVRA